ncbi:hypothetical protein RRG08_021542 [Elysia crispata]|uniref:Integrase zinc-binding domain-containing protein n=1 Tax=Elysia crispata TaxID=231223 RepID=A0AAE0XE35_9GAST|nr:hypothetical protein RRG08_021542 [Elysia crispata]
MATKTLMQYPEPPPPSPPKHDEPHTIDSDAAEDKATTLAVTEMLRSVTNIATRTMVREATASDTILQRLITLIHSGIPDQCQDVPSELQPYHRYAASLFCIHGDILTGHRIVILAALQPSILNALHAAHQGVVAMCARTADSVFWPNITTNITRTRNQCAQCNRAAKANTIQLPTDIIPPDYPFQQLCRDYFSYNNHGYAVIVDRYSSWSMVFRSEAGAEGLVRPLRETFVDLEFLKS